MGEVTREAFTVSNIHTSTHHLMLKPLFYAAGHIHARMQVTSALCYAAGHIHARTHHFKKLTHTYTHTQPLFYAAGHNR